MSEPIRRSDVAEVEVERAFYYFGGAVGLALLGFLIGKYIISSVFVTILFGLLTLVAIVAGVSEVMKTKKIPSVKVRCPYCNAQSEFTESPTTDFTCSSCHRRVAVENGRILNVIEVKCGFCGSLQRFSERTEVALCEECDHEIPLASSPTGEMRHMARGMAVDDDNRPYDLVLLDPGTHTDQVIGKLQQVLALNRNQVKEIVGTLPTVLLTGIPKRKAQMLSEDLTRIGAKTEFRLTSR